MKNIVLTGFMGTGKTAVGKELSIRLGLKLIDVDTEIEISRDMSIAEIFKKTWGTKVQGNRNRNDKKNIPKTESRLYRPEAGCPEARKYGNFKGSPHSPSALWRHRRLS